MTFIIRKERPEDFHATEHMMLRAFWNIHGPGCNEHLLTHKLRTSPDYLPDVSRVAELDGKIVGAILFSRSEVIDGDTAHEVITFGPLAVEPTMQSQGVGEKLMEASFQAAKEAGYRAVIIFGEPDYYPRHGFQTCDHFSVTTADGQNFDAFMACELYAGALNGVKGQFHEAEVFEHCDDAAELEQFTKRFPPYEPLKLACQWVHAEKIGRIKARKDDAYIIQFWEQELPAKLDDGYQGEPPKEGDIITFLLHRNAAASILATWQKQ